MPEISSDEDWTLKLTGPLVADPYSGPTRDLFLNFLKAFEDREEWLVRVVDSNRECIATLIVGAKLDELRRTMELIRNRLFMLGVLGNRYQVFMDQQRREERRGLKGALPVYPWRLVEVSS